MIWLSLAARNVLANRRRSLVAIAAIAFACIALIIFAGHINNVRQGMKFGFIHGGSGHIQIAGKGAWDGFAEEQLQFGLTPAQVTALEGLADKTPDVRRVVPRLAFSGLVSSGARSLPFSGMAIDPRAERAAFGSTAAVKSGEGLTPRNAEDGVVLGAEMARQLGVKAGDYVTVMATTVSGSLNAMDMTVIGVRELGQAQAETYYLQAKLPAVQRLLLTDKISTLVLLLEEKADIGPAKARMLTAAPGLEARDWLQLNPIYTQVMNGYETQFRVFGGMIIIVTLMGIAVLILTSVMERAREIGVMRALGLSRLQVRASFVLEGLLLCTAGLAAGILLGAGVSWAVNALHLTMPPPPSMKTGYPLRLLWDWWAPAQIAAAVMALGLAASWISSGRIARLRVVQALGAL